jgi:hypothetical protein
MNFFHDPVLAFPITAPNGERSGLFELPIVRCFASFKDQAEPRLKPA